MRSAASPAIFLFGGRNEPSVADAKNFGIYRKFSVLSEIKPFTGNKFFDEHKRAEYVKNCKRCTNDETKYSATFIY